MRRMLTLLLLVVISLATVSCSLTESDIPDENSGGDYEGVFAPVNAIDKAESAADAQETAQKHEDKMIEQQAEGYGNIP